MIIRCIRLTNFGIYAGEHAFYPSTAKEGEGPVTLIGGLNGRGKTSFLEAVLLCLYGSRSPFAKQWEAGYTAYLESLINRRVDKSIGSAVELDLTIERDSGSRESLLVRRSWRVANKRASDKVLVYRNGTEDRVLSANWNTYVEELVPSGVSGLFFFDGEKIASIAEEEETSDSLRTAIRSLLGLDLVDKLIRDLGTIIRRNRSHKEEATIDAEVNAIETELAKLRRSEAVLLQDIANLNNYVLRARARLAELEEQYYRTGGQLAASRSTWEQEQNRLSEELATIRGEMIQLSSEALPLLLVEPLLKDIQTEAQIASSVDQARSVLPLVEARDRQLLTELAQCFPDFTKLDVIARLLESHRQELQTLAERKPTIRLSPVGRGQLSALLNRADELRLRVKQMLERYHHVETELDKVKQHLMFQFDEVKMDEQLRQLAQAAKDLADKEAEKERVEQRLREVQGQIGLAEQQLAKVLATYHEQLSAQDETDRMISVALRSQEALRVFRTRVTERKIQRLEEAIKHSFLHLTHKSALVSAISIDPESLKIALIDATGNEIPKSRLSSGERQMLAVAILWGLARASGRELPVIIDTPMGRLDSSHRMNFVAKYLRNASHQVIVLSTDTEIVGPYLEALDGAVGRKYWLRYIEAEARTEVVQGYFPDQEGAIA